jgi:hypothetical protein
VRRVLDLALLVLKHRDSQRQRLQVAHSDSNPGAGRPEQCLDESTGRPDAILGA